MKAKKGYITLWIVHDGFLRRSHIKDVLEVTGRGAGAVNVCPFLVTEVKSELTNQ